MNLPQICPASKEPSAITIVIPTYNRSELLQRAVASILAERRIPLLIHIFDNASTDDTRGFVEALQKEDTRILYTRRPSNIGGLLNCHRSIESVTTEYFVPLADDDWLLPNFLHDAYAIMERDSSLGAAIFQTLHIRASDGALLGTNPSESRPSGFLTTKRHLIDWMELGPYQWSSILWRRTVLAAAEVPQTAVGLPSDLDFQAQVFIRYPVFRVPQAAAVYQLHPGQASSDFLQGDWRLILQRLEAGVRSTAILTPREYADVREKLLTQWQLLWNHVLMGKSWREFFTLSAQLSLAIGKPSFFKFALRERISRSPWYQDFCARIAILRKRAALGTRVRALHRLLPVERRHGN